MSRRCWYWSIGLSVPIWAGIILLAVTLASCASDAPRPTSHVDVVQVAAPVARSCIPVTLAGPPVYGVTFEMIKAAPGPGEALQLTGAALVERVARLGELEPAVAHCR